MASPTNSISSVSETTVETPVATIGPPVDGSRKTRTNLGRLNLEQELTTFGRWVDDPRWIPPKDSNTELADYLLGRFSPWASREACWSALTAKHRSQFTQVREFELPRPSIRLPRGRIFVTVTEQKDFDKIEDPIPRSVKARLDEFLQGQGKKRGVKVYYLKPLCVEADNQLIFTTRPELDAAVAKIQGEVFAEYRRLYLRDRAKRFATGAVNAGLAIPRSLVSSFFDRKRREIQDFHSKLEFERRHRALQATQAHRRLRTTKCTFDEMLALSDPPTREAVIDHYVAEKELSELDRKAFLIASAVTLPWFVGLSLAITNMAVASLTTASIAVCDPAFVAEMPGSNGKLLKIGHFDEVDGVMHVEI